MCWGICIIKLSGRDTGVTWKEIETFASEEELLYKIDYYLEHEEERKIIAKNGYEKAKEKYSLRERVKELIRNI